MAYGPIADQSLHEPTAAMPLGVDAEEQPQLNRCGRCFERHVRPLVAELIATAFDVFVVCLVEQQLRDRFNEVMSIGKD